MSECAKCKRHEDIRPHGAGGVCFSCATIAELTKELETVREVSSNRLKLWMDVCKERDGLRAENERLEAEWSAATEAYQSNYVAFDKLKARAERLEKAIKNLMYVYRKFVENEYSRLTKTEDPAYFEAKSALDGEGK